MTSQASALSLIHIFQARRDAATARGEQWKYDKHCLNIPKEEALRRMQSGEPYVIRQNIPLTGTASFDDALYGHVEAPCDTLDDNVLIKADGLPTYNFANVIDCLLYTSRGFFLEHAPQRGPDGQREFANLQEAGTQAQVPVSYTHLDVYKRQDLSRGSQQAEGTGRPGFLL